MSDWTRVAPNGGMGLEESWIFRPGVAPLCALRRADGQWRLDLLHLTGISCNVLWISGELTLEEAKRSGEAELLSMGHKFAAVQRQVSGRQREGGKWLGKRSW